MVQLESAPIRFQIDSRSDISAISKELGRWLVNLPWERQISCKKSSAGERNLIDEFACTIILNGTNIHGSRYVIDRCPGNFLDLEWTGKIRLLEVPINAVCNGLINIISPRIGTTACNVTRQFYPDTGDCACEQIHRGRSEVSGIRYPVCITNYGSYKGHGD